jgi:hypothetical protein
MKMGTYVRRKSRSPVLAAVLVVAKVVRMVRIVTPEGEGSDIVMIQKEISPHRMCR